ncbi:MAG: ATP-grasp domain-containing protein [Myxococcota bacterium]
MNILITTSRMPFALDEIRKFGRAGHHVIAADTFSAAPGSHSRYAAETAVYAAPRHDTDQFVRDVRALVIKHEVGLIVPCFEEALYLSRARDEGVDLGAPLFAPEFSSLMTLHDKRTFKELAASVGLPVPRTVIASTPEELRAAAASFGDYFARAAFSRGGVELLTNRGPLADALSIESVDVTANNPMLVQEFIDGTDVCSFSVCHHGRVVAHSTYEHPKEIEHAGGIVFDSVESVETLQAAQSIAAATNYHGQLSLDFMRAEDGTYYLIECNPRPTAGVVVMPEEMFVRAVVAPGEEVDVAPAGTSAKISSALIRDLVLHPECIVEDLEHLFGDAKELYLDTDDPAPGWWQVMSYTKVMEYKRQTGSSDDRADLMAAQFYDVCFNPEEASPTSSAAA